MCCIILVELEHHKLEHNIKCQVTYKNNNWLKRQMTLELPEKVKKYIYLRYSIDYWEMYMSLKTKSPLEHTTH